MCDIEIDTWSSARLKANRISDVSATHPKLSVKDIKDRKTL